LTTRIKVSNKMVTMRKIGASDFVSLGAHGPCLSFLMFVPSQSWQSNHIFVEKVDTKTVFSYLNTHDEQQEARMTHTANKGTPLASVGAPASRAMPCRTVATTVAAFVEYVWPACVLLS